MHTRSVVRGKPRSSTKLLRLALSPLRVVFVIFFVAAVRALGGHREAPRPPPRNPPSEVERR